jgi:protease-4
MDQSQLPASPSSTSGTSGARKGWSPLAIVLGLSAAFFAVFLAISGIFFMHKSPGAGSGGGSSTALFSNGSVAVIELNGVIMDSKKILKKLERFEDDGDVKAVVLRLNSPGGAVAPSQEIYQAVKNYKKPIVASMSSVAASGAYYVACGAKKVYANPGTITGSIGVIMEFANLSKLYDWAKISRYSIKTGKFKDVGAEYRDMSADERALLQNMVDDVLVQFKTAVSTGRKLSMAEVTAIADGRIFSGSQAKKAHLVDELGTLDDAVNEAGKMAGIKGKPSVVYPSANHKHILDMIFDQGKDDDDSESSQTRSGLLGRLLGTVTNQVANDFSVLSPGIYWLWSAGR